MIRLSFRQQHDRQSTASRHSTTGFGRHVRFGSLGARAATVGALLAITVAAGCTTSRPVRKKAPEPTREQVIRDVQRRFSDASYIVGFGSGETEEQAEERARVDAAARIRSEISANTEIVETSEATGEYLNQVTSHIVERVHSELGALIRAERELTRKVTGGSFVGVAVIARDELDQKYAAEAAPLLERITGAWNRAVAAGEAHPDAVAAALCEADLLERDLDEKDLERRLVTRRTAWTGESLELRKQVVALRERLKSSTEVQVVRNTSGAVTGQDVADVVLRNLVALGYPARVVDAPSCAERDAMLLDLQVAESCGQAPIGGVRCEVRIATRGSRCNRSGALFEVASESGRALHATNEALALRQAAKKIDLDGYATNLSLRVVSSMDGSCGR